MYSAFHDAGMCEEIKNHLQANVPCGILINAPVW